MLVLSFSLSTITVPCVLGAEDSWKTRASTMPRRELGVTAVNGKIYIIGGFEADGTPTNVTQVYDPETNFWSTKALMPTSMGCHAAAVVNSSVYVFGGTTQWITGSNFDLTQVYDTKSDTWSYATPIPMAPAFPAAGATTGVDAPKRIYIISYPNITQVYNPEDDTWSTGTEMATNRGIFGVAVVNDRLYVIGGGSAIFPTIYFSGENEEYTPFGYIPEFPALMMLPLFLFATLVVVGIKRKVFRPT